MRDSGSLLCLPILRHLLYLSTHLPPVCWSSERLSTSPSSPRIQTPSSGSPKPYLAGSLLVPPGEQKNDALIPSLADTTQFLALSLTLLFLLPSSQSWSTLRLGVAADGIASGFAGEGQEEFRASSECRACIPSQWPQDLAKTMTILAAPSPEPCPGGLLSTTPPPVADIP